MDAAGHIDHEQVVICVQGNRARLIKLPRSRAAGADDLNFAKKLAVKGGFVRGLRRAADEKEMTNDQ